MKVMRTVLDPPDLDSPDSLAVTAADEALDGSGVLREHYADMVEALAASDLNAISKRVQLDVRADGVVFRSVRGPQPFFLDPVPRIFTAGEWDLLEQGLAQRVRALNAFLVDVYSDRLIEREGRVPPWLLEGAAGLEPDVAGLVGPGMPMAQVAGLDVVRDASGELLVLEDNLRTPSGCAYAEAARAIGDRHLPIVPPPRRSVERELVALLGDALRSAAPDGRDDPCVVLLSDGPTNSAWWEHNRLAAMLQVPLVEPGDLVSGGARLRARMGPAHRAVDVDVVYRRTDESRLRDDSGRLTWVGEALLEPCRLGTVACVNSFGTGVGDDKLVHAYVEEMIRFYLGQEPLVRSVRTYDPGDPEVRVQILERIAELVVKPRGGFGGQGVIVCPHADPADRERAARLIRDHPDRYVAQETVALSTHPTIAAGRLAPRHVDLRAFVFTGRTGERVLPGGLTRVALDAGALVVNSSQAGGGKDTWVLS